MCSFQTSRLLASIGKKTLTKSPHKNKQSSNMDETSTVKHLEESSLESPGWGLQGSSWKTRKFSTRKSKSDKDPAVDMEVIITCSCFCVPSVSMEILLFVWFGTIHLLHHDGLLILHWNTPSCIQIREELGQKKVAAMLLLPLGVIKTIDVDPWASSRAKNHLFVHPTWVE